MMNNNPSISISNPHPTGSVILKIASVIIAIGLILLIVAAFGGGSIYPLTFLLASIGVLSIGLILYVYNTLGKQIPGVKNNHVWFHSISSKGTIGWILGVLLTGFYVILYWNSQYLEHLIRMTDPLSQLIRGNAADQWFLYGFFYTIAILLMGIKAIYKYRHSKYQIIRTLSIIIMQTGFGFLIPGILQLFNQPEFYFSYFWPLKYDYLFPSTIGYLTEQPGGVGTFMVFWGVVMTFIATPTLTYFFGKRWYCSWVCGCGGLANTAGDDFRQLSDKSLKAWKIERWSVHLVLVFVVLTTSLLWTNSFTNGAILGELSQNFSKAYGFYIGAIFSGVIGVGFYPLLGTRVWCRFGCPMAAILGILQKYFSRFRITTNGGQCISCGNCSTYCEMGIDVRWYAQRGQNINRASCVGCGICSTVCPRGVLNLENGPLKGKYNNPNNPISISEKETKLTV